MGAAVRCAPGDRQLADCLTKNDSRPADLVRGMMKAGKYQIADETFVLDTLARERESRRALGQSWAEEAGSRRTPTNPEERKEHE